MEPSIASGTAELSRAGILKERAHVGGEWVGAGSGRTFEVLDPASREVIARVPDMDAADTREAIAAAERALPGWRARTAKQRAAVLRRWYELILERQEELALLMTLEQGKPLAEARGEVAYGASFVEWFAEEAKRVYGEVVPGHLPGKRIVVLRQPVGVFAAITPWNFPVAMITRKVAPGLAAGCTAVVKPASETPLSALALAALAAAAGIPAGVLNVVTTSDAARVGAALTSSPIVRKLSFTGSTAVGKLLMAQCAGTVKRLSLELGGNAPFLVFDDADLEAAVAGAVASKYRNAGQTCICANRFLVQEGIYDRFARRLAAAAAALPVGNGRAEGVAIGPLITEKAAHDVDALVRAAVAGGARAITGGPRREAAGSFYEPTVLTGVDPGMAVVNEEIFGPVAPLVPFATEEEAIRLANDTPYGLAAYFYTRDPDRIWRVAEGLEYGMVGVNEGLISTEVAPFGGVKESGLGREGSRLGIEEFLEVKYLCLGSAAG
ncbi:MAG: NAD-dependent succinate-semialdehyde dehydrogenase [Acidobacteriota bacterium]|nr:NAD-dependent succinate-semialdehyde dehydrogenase [Acidobacteriota bacterium]MDH3523098.1 NAD-dependent succinate-semialdehyde dehydrogenase [Acidobacteriota bacterium]